jgi:D-tyrosyl-tRNA(Tyr) deacylase
VSVDNRIVAEINPGLVILLGIGHDDDESKISYLTDKIASLRIFEDAQGKMNQSLLDVHGAALVVSQFTLYADMSKGRRPSFTSAALPEIARPLVESFAKQLTDLGVPTQQGEFGAHMLVEIDNDGPVTIILER